MDKVIEMQGQSIPEFLEKEKQWLDGSAFKPNKALVIYLYDFGDQYNFIASKANINNHQSITLLRLAEDALIDELKE